MAMVAQRLGFSTILIERGRHPRFTIGESSTPLANLLLEEIAIDHDLPFIRPLCHWGTWQANLPQLGCGLKRGFSFYHHQFDSRFDPDPNHERQLLVGANLNEETADTHWYRPDFDHYLVQKAERLGVKYWDEMELREARAEAGVMRLRGKRRGEVLEVEAEFVIDATGPRGFLFRKLKLPEMKFGPTLSTQALFSHFRGVRSLPHSFSSSRTPPYPPEQAAVHHVFPGGWVWVLKFNNGIISAGVAATDEIAKNLRFSSGQTAWDRLLMRLPSLAEMFEPAQAVVPFVHSRRIAFRSREMAGPRWALLPSAAGFVDPLLSTGFPLALLGVKRIGQILRSHWQRPSFESEMEEYARLTADELDSVTALVKALYSTMDRFDLFRQLALLYFACASYSEMARRLGKLHLADSFLLCRHTSFAKHFKEVCALAQRSRSARAAAEAGQKIREAIEPFDVAGLADLSRNHWYPSRADDLLRNRAKLCATEKEITTALQKCGL